MKICVIPDIHGRTVWRNIITTDNYDKIVFLGDYLDTRDYISINNQCNNFREIVRYKKANKNQVILLLGNHDFHYTLYCRDSYSGYKAATDANVGRDVLEAIKDGSIEACYSYDKFLFSHAGISKEWLENNNCENFDNPEKIAIFVNNLLRYTPRVFNFTPGPNNSVYGDDTCQGPIWIRPDSLLKSSLEGITQVVGHTQDEKIIIHNNLILTDTLGYSKEFLVITDGVPEIRLIK